MVSAEAALVAGVLQGFLEWLPVSSEGMVSLFLSLVDEPEAALSLSLFLHAGTAASAAVYYRGHIVDTLRSRDGNFRFYLVATLLTGVVGLSAYLALMELVTELSGGLFVALIGGLLVATGLLQRTADAASTGEEASPGVVDAALVGSLQGLAILPGVSRSGTTVSALLLRGYGAPSALRLSFVLGVPASLGAGVLTAPSGFESVGVAALAVSGIVGYLTIDGLTKTVEKFPFWAVCVALGGVAVAGGLLLPTLL